MKSKEDSTNSTDIETLKGLFKAKFRSLLKTTSYNIWLDGESKENEELYLKTNGINRLDNFSSEEEVQDMMKTLEQIFILGNVKKMTYKEKVTFWDDLDLNFFIGFGLSDGEGEVEYSVIPESYEEKVFFVSFYWNKFKKQLPIPKPNIYSEEYWTENLVLLEALYFDNELYESVILKRIKKFKIQSISYYDYIDLETQNLQEKYNKWLKKYKRGDFEIGYNIAIEGREDYLFRLYDDQYTPFRILGYVFAKKMNFLRELKENKVSINKEEPSKHELQNDFNLFNEWDEKRNSQNEKVSYNKTIKILQTNYHENDQPFVKNINGRLEWIKYPSKGWASYLKGFYYTCFEHGWLKREYSGDKLVLLTQNSFNISIARTNFTNDNLVNPPTNHKYLEPFKKIPFKNN